MRLTSRTASTQSSLRNAYSVSVNFTSRGDAKTRYERSIRTGDPDRRAATRLSVGIARWKRRPVRHTRPNSVFTRKTSCHHAETLDLSLGGSSTRLFVRVIARSLYGNM